MADPTSTLEEIGTELRPAPPGHEHGSLTAWIEDLIFTVDHKKLGLMYLGAGWLFFLAGGILALLIRTQIAVPNNHMVDPETFNGAFTKHGTTMILLFAMLMVFGLANYIVPLQIGARDMAFPRLNAFSFWCTFFGGCSLFLSYVAGPGLYGTGAAPDAAWFALAFLTSRVFSPGNNIDFWSLGLLITGVGSITGGVNIMVTIFCYRTKGMTLTARSGSRRGRPAAFPVRVERLMPLTPLHVLYFHAEIQKTDTYQSGGRLPEGFFAKKESHDRSCAFLE